jgi:predicted metal-dependent HD superfamily phosphohydrolase
MEYNQAKEFILSKLDGLSDRLSYHKKQHTLDVLKAVEEIAENEQVNDESKHLLQIAALMHDAGFLEKYQGHEEKGCEYAQNWLPQFGYSHEQIERVVGMIRATKIPHEPKNKEEQIICDADLDYLGTDAYDKISETLFKEWKCYGFVNSSRDWLEKQIGFLKLHRYFSDFSTRERVAKKKSTLKQLEARYSAGF